MPEECRSQAQPLPRGVRQPSEKLTLHLAKQLFRVTIPRYRRSQSAWSQRHERFCCQERIRETNSWRCTALLRTPDDWSAPHRARSTAWPAHDDRRNARTRTDHWNLSRRFLWACAPCASQRKITRELVYRLRTMDPTCHASGCASNRASHCLHRRSQAPRHRENPVQITP